MKETLDDQSRAALVAYRIERAHEYIRSSAHSAGGGFYNVAVNNLYYACYYAAVALLLQHKIEAATHAGVNTMLGLHFVRTGLLDAYHGATFTTLFNQRQCADYGDFFHNTQNDVDTLTPRAVSFVEAIEQLIARG